MSEAQKMLHLGLQRFREECEAEPWKDEDKCFWLLQVLKRIRSAASKRGEPQYTDDDRTSRP